MKNARLVTLTLGLAGIVLGAEEPQWNQFRGPTGDGQSSAVGLPTEWSETKNVVWKTPVAGKAWASPVIWQNQVWLANSTEDGKERSALCVDKETGKVIYNLKLFEVEDPQFCHTANSYASPTPVIEAGRVYVHFGSAGTACIDTATGKTIWQRTDLECDHWRGAGSSPVMVDNHLILTFDGYDLQYVVALDKQTGKTVWKQDRQIDYGTDDGDHKKAYSTPGVVEHNGKKLVVSQSAVETVTYDAAAGDVVWRVRHGGMNAATKPVFAHGMVYLAPGDLQNALIAVKYDGTGNVTDSHIAWSMVKNAPRRPSQLIVGDYLYMISDNGIASALEAKTGKSLWQKRLGGEIWASPIMAEGRLYISNKEGTTFVTEPGPKDLKVIAENKLDEGCHASPAISGKAIYLRTRTDLYRIENR